jgi:transposase
MSHLSAEAKHHILLEYSPHYTTYSFAALARRHAIKGGHETVRQWHRRWDGTVQSLKEKQKTGRPRILSRAEVSRHVRVPILAANRFHRAIHYTTLLPSVKAKTGKEISIQTLRRIGKEELGAKQKRSKKRTADESESIQQREKE